MKRNQLIKLLMALLVFAVAFASILLTLNWTMTQQTQPPLGLGTQSEGGITPALYYTLNVTVIDGHNQPLKNVWVIVFQNSTAQLYGYTGIEGNISFQALAGNYIVQFEKYHYTASPLILTIKNDTNVTQSMQMEIMQVFGVPSWAIIFIIGLILSGLLLWNWKALKIGEWGSPENWFGKSRNGTWTFLDKSTKAVLYGITGSLLVILIAFVVPNFPTFRDMAFYYVAIGFIVLVGLLIEGKSKESWIAALGFGKTEKLLGNVLIGLAFALIFIGITGFYSQLSVASFAIPIGSLLSIFMVVIVASFFEEGFWSGLLAPTIAEKTGIVSSIFFTSVVFMFAHGLTYGWAMIPLLSAFIFRIFATIIVLHQKSWIGMFFAHVVINVISLYSMTVFL